LYAALKRSKQLKLTVLIDFLRGGRGEDHSVSLLEPLLRDFPGQVQLWMHHTPLLSGMMKRFCPPRFNEGLGTMHLKVYGFDHRLILSGANLNQDYFKNRQDRYILFKDHPLLVGYFTDLIQTIGQFSHSVQSTKELSILKKQTELGYSITEATQTLLGFRKRWNIRLNQIDFHESGTFLIPTLQSAPFGIRDDEIQLQWLLDRINGIPGYQLTTCSGYLNFPSWLEQRLLDMSLVDIDILSASPKVNAIEISWYRPMDSSIPKECLVIYLPLILIWKLSF
jgi:CDP-diacylglycerol--glycerol-3-phosphate 3-phosphatidyltransferase